MSDRIKGLIVTFDKSYKDEDIEKLKDAIIDDFCHIEGCKIIKVIKNE